MTKRLIGKSQLWLILLGFSMLALLLYSKRADLSDTYEALKTSDLRLVALLPFFQMASWFFVGKFYQSMFAIFKARITAMRAWGVVGALTFVNQILPSGGASGLTYLVYGFRNQLSAGKVSLIQLARYILSMTVYIVLAPIVIVMVYISGEKSWLTDTFNKATDSPSAIGFTVGFFLIIGVVVFTLRSRNATHALSLKLERGINKVVRLFRRKSKQDLIKTGAIGQTVHEFHDGFDFLKQNSWQILKPFSFMVLSTFFELAIVYTAFLAVGGNISIGVLLVAFIAANIAGVVSIIPGDVGVHESVMIIMLSSLGIDGSIAISATLLYRIFNKMLFMPIGFFFYARLLRPAAEGKVA